MGHPAIGVDLLHKPLEPISKLVPYSALIISIILVIFFLVRFYLFERFLIQRVYGTSYTDLNETNRRGFINHHIAGITKIAILIAAAYPFIAITFCGSTFHSPFANGSITKGDILVVVAQMLIAIYIFELLYRVKLSPVAVLHHIGTIIIGQTALAISLQLAREPDADIEFILCTVWGAFDTLVELFPHFAIILYRVYPMRHDFLRRVFLWSCFITAAGTFCETIVAMTLFGLLWQRWEIAFKIVTPMLHIAFSAAQIHGSLVFWRMYRKQSQFLLAGKDEEQVQQAIGETYAPTLPQKAAVAP